MTDTQLRLMDVSGNSFTVGQKPREGQKPSSSLHGRPTVHIGNTHEKYRRRRHEDILLYRKLLTILCLFSLHYALQGHVTAHISYTVPYCQIIRVK